MRINCINPFDSPFSGVNALKYGYIKNNTQNPLPWRGKVL